MRRKRLIATHSDHAMRSFADLVSVARSRDTPLSYGTNGQGSTQHLLIELFARMAKVRLQHVPYRGGAQALTDVLGKRIDFMLDPPIIFLEHIQAGRLRPLATTGSKRFEGLPEVPTIAESGFAGFAISSWFGVLGPAGMPEPIVSKLNAELAAILHQPDIQQRLRTLGKHARALFAGRLQGAHRRHHREMDHGDRRGADRADLINAIDPENGC